MQVSPWFLYCGAVLHTVISGSFYGFWSLRSILSVEGGYRELCSSTSPCLAQSIQYSSTFTNTSVLAFGVPLLSGLVVLHLGPRKTVFLLTLVAGVGWLLFLLSSFPGRGQLRSEFILPAFSCLGIAAAANYLPLLSVASLFTHRSLALSVLSGSFDAGSGVPLIMRLLYESGTPFSTILIAQLAGPIALMLLLAVFIWRDVPYDSPSKDISVDNKKGHLSVREAGVIEEGSMGAGPLVDAPTTGSSSNTDTQGVSLSLSQMDSPQQPPKYEILVQGATLPSTSTAEENPSTAAKEATGSIIQSTSQQALTPSSNCPFFPSLNIVHLQALSLPRQLLTLEYLGFLVYFSVLSLRFNYFLSTTTSQIDAMEGREEDLGTALGFFMPTLAIPAVLLAGWFMGRWGPLAGMSLLSSLGVAVSALHMVPSPKLQYLTYILFVFFRGALFSALSVFLSVVFGFSTLGALVGTATAVAGIFSLLSTPLLSWGLAGDGGFKYPNSLILALTIASFAFPMWMARRGGHKSLLKAISGGSPLGK